MVRRFCRLGFKLKFIIRSVYDSDCKYSAYDGYTIGLVKTVSSNLHWKIVQRVLAYFLFHAEGRTKAIFSFSRSHSM